MQRNSEQDNFLMQTDEETLLMVANVQRLLMSQQLPQVQTGVEMIRSGGLPPVLYNYLMFAYLVAENQEVREEMREIFYAAAISERTKRYFKKILMQPWVILSGTERSIRERIRRYITDLEEFDGMVIAQLFYQQAKRGYVYILEEGDEAIRLAFLRQALHKDVLDLSRLNELFRLPIEIRQLNNIRQILLYGCNFRVFPDALYHPQFKDLELVDLRQNPIKKVPTRTKKHLPICRILIG